jgi:hypothetical protein
MEGSDLGLCPFGGGEFVITEVELLVSYTTLLRRENVT